MLTFVFKHVVISKFGEMEFALGIDGSKIPIIVNRILLQLIGWFGIFFLISCTGRCRA